MEPPTQPAFSDDLVAISSMAEGMLHSLRLARALAGQGRPVELDGMQDSVGLLCAKALDLKPDEGRILRVALVALRDEVDQLSATLRSSGSD